MGGGPGGPLPQLAQTEDRMLTHHPRVRNPDKLGLRGSALSIVLLTSALLFSVAEAEEKLADRKTLIFAAQMAENGSWREAKFRWEKAQKQAPENSHIANNLAVACEALGLWDEAGEHYQRAIEIEDDNLHIQDNLRRHRIFQERLKRYDEQGLAANDESAGDRARRLSAPAAGKKGKKRGKTGRVTVGLPIPPRLKVEGDESILIISFLDDETRFLDINREMVRYLRSAFKRRTAHEILDIVPPPAVPEQRPEDLLANAEFWKYLHREFGADLIVSGVLGFDREDVSGYADIDTVSQTTGQKIRQTRFVERERFSYYIEIFFMDGATGKPLYQDKLQRSAIIQGSQNDPITTFFELSDTISTEVLSIITTRTRPDSRTIFKH